MLHLAREEQAAPALAQRLGLASGSPVFHTLIVHHEDGVPLQCEDRYVNPACAPGYLDVDFTRMTPTHYLLQVADRQGRRDAVEVGGERADALDPIDQAFRLQLAQRPRHGHPADAELGHELGVGRHQRARHPASARQFLFQELLDPRIRRGRPAHGRQ